MLIERALVMRIAFFIRIMVNGLGHTLGDGLMNESARLRGKGLCGKALALRGEMMKDPLTN